jgi:hypothetical protein
MLALQPIAGAHVCAMQHYCCSSDMDRALRQRGNWLSILPENENDRP